MSWIYQLQSANWSQASGIALTAYLFGCFATGYYLVRMRLDQDIRDLGSGSVGAKNVRRFLGWPGFVTVVLGDVSKGMFAVWVARHFTQNDRIVALAMVAVVVGHIWPAQLWFRGGKGIATSLGALLIYDYHLIVAFLLLFLGFFVVLRKSVIPGIFAIACLPLVSMYLANDSARVVGISIVSGLVLISHRRNLMEESFQFVERRKIRAKHNRTDL